MDARLRILIIEDNPDDVVLVERELEKAQFKADFLSIATHEEFLHALTSFHPDVILSDYTLPQFDVMAALGIVQEQHPFTPFIIVTGTRTEEIAVSCMRAGATDYVLKDHLSRLGSSVWTSVERKRKEMELRQNQEMFRLITDSVSDLISIVDRNGKRLYNSKSYLRVLGEADNLRGTDSFQEIHPDDRERIKRIFQETISTGVGQRTNYRFLLKDHSVRYIESVGSVILDQNGQVANVVVVSRDVTEQKEVERQLRLLAYALTCTQDYVTLTDLDGRILFVNESLLKGYDFSEDQLTGEPISRIWPVSSVRQILATTREKGAWTGELISSRCDGSEFHVELWTSIVSNEEGEPIAIIGVSRDITQRREADEALRASEERYRQFFEDDLTGDFVSTPDGTLLSCNPAFVRMFGFSSVEEAMQSNMYDLYSDTTGRDRFLGLLRKREKLEYYEAELRRKDGTRLHVIENAIGVFDAEGALVRIRGYLFDNTELKRLEEQLLQTQKMEAVGQLAGGIAHEFNNVMTIILTAAETLKSKTSEQNTVRLARMIESSTQRGIAIAKQMLQFSRAESPKLEPTSLSQVILEVWKLLERTFPKTVKIDVKTGVTHGYILGDAGLLQQMLLNICNNAKEAMTRHGEEDAAGSLTLSLEYATGEFVERKFGTASAERYIAICVQDTGRGMPDEVRRKMFEPFFTTKDIGKGTGLGLSIVHGIVRSHHGIIDVESGPQGGTRFIVYLPQTERTPKHVEEEKPERMPGTGEHILIVEDEDDVRALLMEWLSEAGYTPSEAADGAEALEIIKGNGNFQLVLADIGLPKLDGMQLFGKLRTLRPDIPVVFCTGFIDEDRHATLMETGARAIIRKPYRIDDVLNAIHTSLVS